jgi:initiation factor 1A
MVRNEGGGNKMKHLARKHVNGSSQQQNKFLRVSQSKDEIYAYIIRLLGNSMCLVKCVDGYERLCHIRGKFTGRSKRENALSQGTWVLIGLRQWDADKEFASKVSKTDKKIQKCDLLEIYSASERDKLRVQEKIFQDVVTEGNNSDGSNGGGSDNDDEFKAKYNVEFKDQKTLEYQEIVAQSGKLSKMSTTTSYHDIYSQISDSDDDDGDSDGDSNDSNDSNDSYKCASLLRQRSYGNHGSGLLWKCRYGNHGSGLLRQRCYGNNSANNSHN